MHIYGQIGGENYLNLMNFSLNPEEVQFMGASMEKHRISKIKPVPLASVLKQRKTEMLANKENGNYGNQNYQNENFNTMNQGNCYY